MGTTLLTTGLVCIIASIIGGGLTAFGFVLPVLQSTKRQVLLGLFGFALLFAGLSLRPPDTVEAAVNPRTSAAAMPSAPSQDTTPGGEPDRQRLTASERERLLDELHDNNERIASIRTGMAQHAEQYREQEPRISRQEARIARGEGTPAEIAEANAAIGEARRVMAKAHEADAAGAEFIGRAEQRNLEIEAILKRDTTNH